MISKYSDKVTQKFTGTRFDIEMRLDEIWIIDKSGEDGPIGRQVCIMKEFSLDLVLAILFRAHGDGKIYSMLMSSEIARGKPSE